MNCKLGYARNMHVEALWTWAHCFSNALLGVDYTKAALVNQAVAFCH